MSTVTLENRSSNATVSLETRSSTSAVTWASITTTWASEMRTWAGVAANAWSPETKN